MAKRRSGGRVVSPMRTIRGRITWGADTTVFKYYDIDTGMDMVNDVGQRYKWMVRYCYFGPNRQDDVGTATVVHTQAFQLLLSAAAPTAILEQDDSKAIATKIIPCIASATGQALQTQWPVAMPIFTAKPVYAKHLYFGCVTDPTNAYWASKDLAFELGYTVEPISADEIQSFVASYGGML